MAPVWRRARSGGRPACHEHAVVQDGDAAVDRPQPMMCTSFGNSARTPRTCCGGVRRGRSRRRRRRWVTYITPSTTSGLDSTVPRLLHLIDPLGPEPGDVGRRDLGEGREAMPIVRARVGEPRPGLARRRTDARVRRLGAGGRRTRAARARRGAHSRRTVIALAPASSGRRRGRSAPRLGARRGSWA